MPDRRLHNVVAVARAGSFTKAARTVGITQSGLTKSIADLERELGYSLFHRVARGALLTEQGREFVERASRLLEDTRILLKGDGEKDPFAKVLRIGVCPASLEWLLADPLAALLRRHPKIIFDLAGSSFERVVQLLRNGGVDVAIGFEDAFVEWSDFKRTPIAHLLTQPFVRKGHPILECNPVLNSDFAKYDFIAPSDSRPYDALIRGLYENQGIPWQRHVHMVDNFAIVKLLVSTSDAIGVTTSRYAASPGFAASFARIPGPSLFTPAKLCCAIRSRWEPSAPVKAFLRVIQERLPRKDLP
jgi:DNA-binding transcriptional LysR family regulator